MNEKWKRDEGLKGRCFFLVACMCMGVEGFLMECVMIACMDIMEGMWWLACIRKC
jgi:hypothetical protein